MGSLGILDRVLGRDGDRRQAEGAFDEDKLADVVLVPSQAVQQGTEGNFLYIAKPDNTVEPRKIEVLATYRGLAAIGQGVAAGENVVTDGQLRLMPGAQIQTRTGEAETAKSATPTAPAAR